MMQRSSRVHSVSASVSRISWSSAPRLSGFEMRMRRTFSSGSSRSSFPDASCSVLLEDNEGVSLRDRLPLLAADLLHRAVVLGLHRHLHLHRLEDHERVALGDLLPELAFDLPHRSGDVGLHVRQRASSWSEGLRHDTRPCHRNWRSSSPPTTRRNGWATRSQRCAPPSQTRCSAWLTIRQPTGRPKLQKPPARTSSERSGGWGRAAPIPSRRGTSLQGACPTSCFCAMATSVNQPPLSRPSWTPLKRAPPTSQPRPSPAGSAAASA